MHDNDRRTAVIVGAGIGGLTAAIALRARGIDAHVYEAAPALRAAGAGLWLSPNAMQVLRRLDLADAAFAAGVPLERAEVHDVRDGMLQHIDFVDATRRYGAPTVAIHRRRLHELLAERVPADRLHYDAACRRVSVGGAVARAELASGETVAADLLIGADGLRSVVREAVAPGVAPRYSGQTSMRGIATIEPPRDSAAVSRELWAPGRRVGYSIVAPRQVYWFATFDAPAGGTESPEDTARRARALFGGFPAPVPALIDATDPAQIIRTDLHDLPPLAAWSRGPVVLLGDAAHATTPNLGQGAAQAIEDAWVLADELARAPSVAHAISAYERRRVPKARFVVERSRQMGRLAHLANPFGRVVRNLAMRWTPASVTRRELDRLYALRD